MKKIISVHYHAMQFPAENRKEAKRKEPKRYVLIEKERLSNQAEGLGNSWPAEGGPELFVENRWSRQILSQQ